MSDCPDEARILDFVRGAADPKLATHLGDCVACRTLVSELALAERGAPWGQGFQRYRVLDVLGAGGMGVVYRAFDPELERLVALKVLVHPPAEGGAGALLQEARAMARLAHPNIVTIYDVGTFQDHVFVALELVEGVTLDVWLRERERSLGEILSAFLHAGRGLEAAHLRGLVHRDFKPQNVLVGTDGRVRVTDFGLALHLEARAPGPSEGAAIPSQAVIGTPSYMAPEQLERGPVDARADQFGFCVALWEALHGERPFETSGLPPFSRAPLRAPAAGSRVPAGLQTLLERGLQAHPEARFPSMGALLEGLEPRPRRATRWKAWAALSAVVLAVVAGGLARRALSFTHPSTAALRPLNRRACGPAPLAKCANDEVCRFPAGNECGLRGSSPGACWARPRDCNAFGPLACGCDGLIYANKCSALQAGVAITHLGPCP